MKSSKVLSAFLALLLMANMSFAKNMQIEKKINEKARYEKVLKDIEDIRGSRKITTTAAFASLANILGCYGNASTFVLLNSAGEVAMLVGMVATAVAVKEGYNKLRYKYSSAKKQADQYRYITRALADGKVFSRYKVLLADTGVDPDPNDPHINKETRKQLLQEAERVRGQLAKFLANPHNMVPWDKIGPEADYRFYFDVSPTRRDLANRNIYADVYKSYDVIVVRSSAIR